MIPVLVVSVVFVLAAVAMLSIRMLLVKGGQFRGTCAGNSPFLIKEGVTCSVCGSKPGDTCGKDKGKTFTASENPA